MKITGDGVVIVNNTKVGIISKYDETDEEISARVGLTRSRISNAVMKGRSLKELEELIEKENKAINRILPIIEEQEETISREEQIRKDLEGKADHADVIYEIFMETDKVDRVWSNIPEQFPEDNINPTEMSLFLMDHNHKVLVVIFLEEENKYDWAMSNYDKEESNKTIAGHPVTKIDAMLNSLDEDFDDAHFVVLETEEDGMFLKIRDTIHGLTEPKLITQEELDQAYDSDIKVFKITELAVGIVKVDVTQRVGKVDEVRPDSEAEFVQDFNDFSREFTRMISEDNPEDVVNELLDIYGKLLEGTGEPSYTPVREDIDPEHQELFGMLSERKVENIIKDIGPKASKADIIIDYFSPLDIHFVLRDDTLTFPLGSELCMDKVALLTSNSSDNIVVVTKGDETYRLLLSVTNGDISFK